MHRMIFLYYLILALALLTNCVTMRLRKLPVGRAWEALREDEIACRSLGINTTNTKLTAFAIGAMFGGFAGSFFAVRQGFVSPESFNFLESAIILAIVVLGGMGSQIGVAIGAVVLVGGPEVLRNLGFLSAVFGEGFDPNEYRLLLFGMGMVAMMVWRPRGLISERQPSVFLKERKAISSAHVKEGHGYDALAPGSRSRRSTPHHALRRPGGDQRSQLPGRARRHHGAHRPERRRQDDGLQLHHRFLQTDRRHDRAAQAATGRSCCSNGCPGFSINWKAKVARTFQNIRLFSGMTVLENLLVAQHNSLMIASGFTFLGVLGVGGYRKAEAEAIERAKYWLEKIRLTDRADDPAGDLPYGAQRRLEIARAMCTDPLLLCLDEPAAGLNPRESHELNELLLSIRKDHGTSILLIEHDMSVVMEISDHVVVLDYGTKISDGTPLEIRNDPRVIAAYLGVADEEIEQVAAEIGA